MMHTFRLPDMAAEILSRGEVIVRRPNQEELLQIRARNFNYDELIARAEAQILEINTTTANSILPKRPDIDRANQVLIEMRKEWHEQTKNPA